MNTDHWITAVLAVRQAKHVVVFTGAGVSAESGIPTFRDADGFWQKFPPERFATWNGLLQVAVTNPRSLAEFVLHVVEPIASAIPNPAHDAIARLGERVRTTVVTQNIDGLHQSAGSQEVLEIHGTLLEVAHSSTGEIVHRYQREDLLPIADALRRYVEHGVSLTSLVREMLRRFPIDWRGRHRPKLVLFGNALSEPDWTTACQVAEECDVLISVGTSGAVFPAAMLPHRAERVGATVITVDPKACIGCWLEGNAGKVLPALVRDAFGDPEAEHLS